MINFNYKNLTPFKWFVLENFPFIEADFDALTEWQLFCKLGKEMNKIINSTNTLGEQTETLTTAFNNLQEYVNQYFSDLNIQNEINNKLNEMAQDGTLAQIINQEIFTDLNNQVIENTQNIETLQGYKMFVNVKAEGIANDGTDVTEDLQALINTYPNGATFYFENGTYYFKNITIPSNSKVLGDSNTKFIIPTNEDINCLFKISNVENIEFENIYMQNGANVDVGQLFGSALVTLGSLKSCIYIENSNNVIMNNLKLDTYFDGLKFYNTNNVKILNSYFKDSGYSSIMVFDNSKNYIIENCIFDNAINNNGTGNSYMIALTGEGYQTSIDVPTNVKIDKCNFYNCSGEGIDTHGGNEITITNCYLENIRVAIALFNDQRFVNRHLKMHDIVIENNIIRGVTPEYGRIQVFGDSSLSDSGEGFLCKNVHIKNNKFIDCDTQTNQYLIYLGYCENIIVKDNIFDTTMLSLRLRRVLFGNVTNNIFKFSTNGNPVELDGVQNVYIEKNTFDNKTVVPDYNIYGGSSATSQNNVFFNDNLGIYKEGFIRNPRSAIGYQTFGMPFINSDYMREQPRKNYYK